MSEAADTTPRGTLRLFTLRGIDVNLHWSWGLVALVEMQLRSSYYDSIVWNFAEYVGLFAIVLLHEFGHAFACRSVGGTATQIMLWPLGGVAYVRPPQRPGAVLWSIAAGPLVNLVLVPVSLVALFALRTLAPGMLPDLENVLLTVTIINVGLFVFNMLPVYPLDGGQIVRALLWFVIGAERSLLVAATFGLVASIVGGLAGYWLMDSYWLLIIGAYLAWRSWAGIRVARLRGALLSGPRTHDAHCPDCGESPPAGALWRCPSGHPLDAMVSPSCPECHVRVEFTPCVFCGEVRPVEAYRPSAPAGQG